ncbi:ileal sodium/bile acid cotransporter [Drosophila sulfurigaster albostrigata]|uniref:ileal sodium/bile acid cotransporter n=1 Tax=Drosophila sulfurigaster albostrigata TaxID=89887 RepID=UPI002D219CCC|nr:ileal sodium/bile acid cotransporter [Drosophila sulfurigaster albostrigata]
MMKLMWLLLLMTLIPASLAWQAHFTPAQLQLPMKTSGDVELLLSDLNHDQLQQTDRYSFRLQSNSEHLATVLAANATIPVDQIPDTASEWSGRIRIEAHFLGEAVITVQLHDALFGNSSPPANAAQKGSSLLAQVVRSQRVIDHVFLGSVILLMSLLYINFGAALNVSVLRGLITRPIGPSIFLITQTLGMPLLSYALGVFIFPDSPAMQLGLFFTGIAPSGGASNTWTAVLGGNINLSVLMTTISNFGAFGSMPFWTFTLGALIFDRAGIKVPYDKIAGYCAGLIIPLFIGLAIQRWWPRLAQILVRLLKPISGGLIIFIVVFAIITNFYIFELFSWQIAVAGLALPGLGYGIAWLAAKLLHQNPADALAIAIETGIQNTGTAIFLLRTTLPQPQADLTTVVPVAVAIMTPMPLLGIYLYQRCRGVKTAEIPPAAEHQRIV